MGIGVATLIIYAAAILFPLLTQNAVDLIIAHSGVGQILSIGVAALVVVGTEAGFSYWRQGRIIKLGRYADRRLSRIIFVQLMRVRVDKQPIATGEMINHFQQVAKIRDFVLYQLPNAVFDVGIAVISIGLVFYYDAWIGVAFVLSIPLLANAAKNQLRALNKLSSSYYQSISSRQNMAAETTKGLLTVRSLAMESSRMTRWRVVTEEMLDFLQEVMEQSRSFILRSQISSRSLGLLALGLGCWRLIEGHITVGDLLALQILSARVTGPVLASADLYRNYQEVRTALAEIGFFLRSEREAALEAPGRRVVSQGSVELRGVTFSYPGRSEPALEDVTIKLPHKGVIALVGHNGSGKSTLMKIIIGIYREYSGDIFIGGHNLKSFDPRSLRKQIAVVEQDASMFSGSLRSNLDPQGHYATDEIENALRFSNALEFVMELPGGLNYALGENGNSLSGGQRQRLAISRAVLRRGQIAIFDEPSAFLDAEAAVKLENKIRQLGKERLVILATHHLFAARSSDRILLLDRGRLVGDGAHDDLLLHSTQYAAMWEDYIRSSGPAEPGAINLL